MSCQDPNASEQVKSACACKSAVDTFIDGMKIYEAQLAAHATASADYIIKWQKYQTDLLAWNNEKNNEKKRLADEEKVWNNCAGFTIANEGNMDAWCQSDTGFGNHVGGGGNFDTGDGCPLFQKKGRCRRTEIQVNSELDLWVAGTPPRTNNVLGHIITIPGLPSHPPPTPPGGGTNGTQTPCSTCTPVSANIVCCSQIISDIQAGRNVNINLAQECSQKMLETALTPTTPTTPTTLPIPTVLPTPIPTVLPAPVPAPYSQNTTADEEKKKEEAVEKKRNAELKKKKDDEALITIGIVLVVIVVLIMILLKVISSMF